MLPEVGATELMIIAAVALIVVGPKDLPMLMRKVGQFLARMRGMAAVFRASFDEMARQSELDELRKEVQALRSGSYMDDAGAALSSSKADVDDVFHEIGRDLNAAPEPEMQVDSWAGIQETPVVTSPEPAAKAPRAAKPKTAAAKPKPKAAAQAKPKAAPKAKASKAKGGEA